MVAPRPARRLESARVSASSFEAPNEPALVADRDLKTYWHSGDESGSDWLAFDLERPTVVTRIGIVGGMVHRGDRMFHGNNRIKSVRIRLDGGSEVTGILQDVTRMQFIDLPPGDATRRVKILITDTYHGSRWHHNIIPEIEVWGYER